MQRFRQTLKVIAFSALFLAFLSQAAPAQEYPAPFDLIKEVAVKQGEKDQSGNFIWARQIEEMQYWMVFAPVDGSVAFGQSTPMGLYSWGVAYGSKGEFQFIETFIGQIANFVLIEGDLAIEIASEFLKELGKWINSPNEVPKNKDRLIEV